MCALRVSCCGWLEILLLPAGAAPNVTFHTSDGHPVGNGGCGQGLRGHVTVVGRQKEMRIHRLDFVPCRQVKLALWLTGCLSCLGQDIQTTVRNWKKIIFFYWGIFCNAFEWDWFKLLESNNSWFDLLCIAESSLGERRRKICKDWQSDSVRSGD